MWDLIISVPDHCLSFTLNPTNTVQIKSMHSVFSSFHIETTWCFFFVLQS